MPRMRTILGAATTVCLIGQFYAADAAPKNKTDGILVLDQKEIAAAQRNAEEVGKVQRFYYYTSRDGVKRQEVRSPATSDRSPSPPRLTPSTSNHF